MWCKIKPYRYVMVIPICRDYHEHRLFLVNLSLSMYMPFVFRSLIICVTNQDCVIRMYLSFFLIYIFIYFFIEFRERTGEGRDRNINDESESLICCLLHSPCWGSSPLPGHAPCPGIKPANFWLNTDDVQPSEQHQPELRLLPLLTLFMSPKLELYLCPFICSFCPIWNLGVLPCWPKLKSWCF